MPKKNTMWDLCQKFIEQHESKYGHVVVLDSMLQRIAIEVSERNYDIKVPVETLFNHLKQQIQIDIDIKQDNLKALQQIELMKLLKGKKH